MEVVAPISAPKVELKLAQVKLKPKDAFTHIADGAHASRRNRVDTRSVILNDGTSTTFNSQDARNLQDDICSPSVSIQMTLEVWIVSISTFRSGPTG